MVFRSENGMQVNKLINICNLKVILHKILNKGFNKLEISVGKIVKILPNKSDLKASSLQNEGKCTSNNSNTLT